MRILISLVFVVTAFLSTDAISCGASADVGLHELICDPRAPAEAQELRFRLLSKSSLEQIEVWEAEVEEVISDEGSNFAPGDLIAVVPFVIALDQSSPPLEQSMIGSFSATNPESFIVDWVKLLTLGDTELELSDGTRAVSYATYRELRLFSPAECVEELEDLGIPATEGTGTCPHGCTSFSFKSASPFFLLFGILWTVVVLVNSCKMFSVSVHQRALHRSGALSFGRREHRRCFHLG